MTAAAFELQKAIFVRLKADAGLVSALGGEKIYDHAPADVAFAAGSVPADGAEITAGYEFDVPVRFDTESLSISLTAFKAGNIPAIPLVEVVI